MEERSRAYLHSQNYTQEQCSMSKLIYDQFVHDVLPQAVNTMDSRPAKCSHSQQGRRTLHICRRTEIRWAQVMMQVRWWALAQQSVGQVPG